VSSLLLRRTLIIDMDLRRPKQFSTFNQPPLPGVTTTVSGQNTPLEAIQATRLENLWILPHGDAAEQPSVVLEQVIQSGLIKQIAQHFDYIFIDTPPISSCADAVMLGQQSDGLVLVARADFTPSITLQQVANRLKSSGVSLLGAVMNSTQTNTDTYYQQQPPASSNGNGNGNGSKSRAFYSIGRQK
ncbi:MAG: CpsD/CapB family tyrosine-protein kinase, partial [Cyanobacteria bacterium J06560_2]